MTIREFQRKYDLEPRGDDPRRPEFRSNIEMCPSDPCLAKVIFGSSQECLAAHRRLTDGLIYPPTQEGAPYWSLMFVISEPFDPEPAPATKTALKATESTDPPLFVFPVELL